MDRRRRRVLEACGLVAAGLAGCLGRRSSPPGTGRQNDTPTPSTSAAAVDDEPETTSESPPGGSTTSPDRPPTDGPTPAGPSRTAWHVPTDATPGRPTVDDGTCFVGTGGLYDDDPAGSILAVDPDGSVRWRKEPGQQSASVVAVDGGVVYAVTGDTSGPHGSNFRLHAYGADGGERRWVWAPERHSTFLQFIGVGEESVFVGTHDDNLEDSGETLVAVDLTDGVPAWERDVGDVRGGALTDGTVVAAGSRRLSAFAIADGSTRWTDEYESDRHVDPTGFSDVVLVGEGTVRALDAVDGTERWTVGDGAVNYVHVAGETAYVGGTTVAALDADGRTDWTYEKPATLSAVVLTEATLFGSSEGALFALAPSDGTEQWRVDVDAEFAAPGAVADGRLASLTREGNVLAVDARDGSEAWSWQTPARLTRPVAAGGRVVVGREGGGLWGLEP